MSVFEGEIEFKTVYMVDFVEKERPTTPRKKAVDDNCLVVGASGENLKVREVPGMKSDVLCPPDMEYYKKLVKRNDDDLKKYRHLFQYEDVDPVPVEHDIQDRKRTQYLISYCSRDLPFMSVKLARRARALQTLRLADDAPVPDTTYLRSFRVPDASSDTFKAKSMRPVYDPSLDQQVAKILKVQCGASTYTETVGMLGRAILEKNPYGKAREEPKYGRWKSPDVYTYQR